MAGWMALWSTVALCCAATHLGALFPAWLSEYSVLVWVVCDAVQRWFRSLDSTRAPPEQLAAGLPWSSPLWTLSCSSCIGSVSERVHVVLHGGVYTEWRHFMSALGCCNLKVIGEHLPGIVTGLLHGKVCLTMRVFPICCTERNCSWNAPGILRALANSPRAPELPF